MISKLLLLLPFYLFFFIIIIINQFSIIEGNVIPSSIGVNLTYQEFFGKQKSWDITKWSEDKDNSSTGNLTYIPLSPPIEGIKISGKLSLNGSNVYYGRRYETKEGEMMKLEQEDSKGFSLIVDPITDSKQIQNFYLQVTDQTSTQYQANFHVSYNRMEFKIYPIRISIPFGQFLPLLDPLADPFNPKSITELGIYVRGPVVDNKNSFLLMIKEISVYSS